MIEPTPGRIVWFRPHTKDLGPFFPPSRAAKPSEALQTPLAAMITGVHSEREINLVVFSFDGFARARTHVRLLQEYDMAPTGESYAEWMPYQKEQAARQADPALKHFGGGT